MKRIAMSVLLAAALISGPAIAKENFKQDHRVNSYYYNGTDRDISSDKVVALSKRDVVNVQSALKAKGYKTGRIDGVLGKQTRSAIKKFQADRHLKGDGKVTLKTLGALRVATRDDFDHRLDRNYN